MSKREAKPYAIARCHGVDIECLCPKHVHMLAMQIRPGLWMCPACHGQYTATVRIEIKAVRGSGGRKRKAKVKRG